MPKLGHKHSVTSVFCWETQMDPEVQAIEQHRTRTLRETATWALGFLFVGVSYPVEIRLKAAHMASCMTPDISGAACLITPYVFYKVALFLVILATSLFFVIKLSLKTNQEWAHQTGLAQNNDPETVVKAISEIFRLYGEARRNGSKLLAIGLFSIWIAGVGTVIDLKLGYNSSFLSNRVFLGQLALPLFFFAALGWYIMHQGAYMSSALLPGRTIVQLAKPLVQLNFKITDPDVLNKELDRIGRILMASRPAMFFNRKGQGDGTH